MKLFRRLRRRLARELPPCLPTRVYIVPRKRIIDEKDSMCITNDEHTGWIIKLAVDLNESERCECLAHEWGHAVADIREEPHDDEWGKAHAAAWRMFDEMLP